MHKNTLRCSRVFCGYVHYGAHVYFVAYVNCGTHVYFVAYVHCGTHMHCYAYVRYGTCMHLVFMRTPADICIFEGTCIFTLNWNKIVGSK